MSDGLERYIKAQESNYETALHEIQSGRKRSHWIWYIFPQFAHEFPGQSSNNRYYGIRGRSEAEEYWANDLLREHLVEITLALLDSEATDPTDVMGSSVDAKKLRSCMTLFSVIAPEERALGDVLDRFFDGKRCDWTIRLLAQVDGTEELDDAETNRIIDEYLANPIPGIPLEDVMRETLDRDK